MALYLVIVEVVVVTSSLEVVDLKVSLSHILIVMHNYVLATMTRASRIMQVALRMSRL